MSSYQIGGSSGDTPTESITITFGTLEMEYTQANGEKTSGSVTNVPGGKGEK